MTSKEKLLQLRHDFYNSEELNYDSIAYFTTIEKDLEILEFIKTHYKMNGFNELIPIYDDIDKFKELEEWLEDESKN